jgi:hypothetical protein
MLRPQEIKSHKSTTSVSPLTCHDHHHTNGGTVNQTETGLTEDTTDTTTGASSAVTPTIHRTAFRRVNISPAHIFTSMQTQKQFLTGGHKMDIAFTDTPCSTCSHSRQRCSHSAAAGRPCVDADTIMNTGLPVNRFQVIKYLFHETQCAHTSVPLGTVTVHNTQVLMHLIPSRNTSIHGRGHYEGP